MGASGRAGPVAGAGGCRAIRCAGARPDGPAVGGPRPYARMGPKPGPGKARAAGLAPPPRGEQVSAMKSLWQDAEAARFAGSPLALRVYTSRLLGREPSLVLHGGGNTSVKTTEADLFGEEAAILRVKGSGWDLATIEAAGFAPVRLDVLRRLGDLPALGDADMVRAMRAAMPDPGAPTPSVEAILHAIIPHAFVDHTHADAVVAVSNTEGGPDRIREIYGERVLVVPYVMPGFVLARTVRELTRDAHWDRIDGMILLHHGVFSFGPDARSSYERMIELVTRAERYLDGRRAFVVPADIPAPPLSGRALDDLAALRRAVGEARGGPVVARFDGSAGTAAFAARVDVGAIATRGPLTPDHVIRTKPLPCVVSADGTAAVPAYAEAYRQYVARHATPGLSPLDPAPRWIVWQGRGSVGIGATVREADIVVDIARHTARAIQWAERLGGWRALPEQDLFDVEYWELEQAKLRTGGAPPPLAGRVALVTGAASGIGRACAEALHAAGAAVLATDVNPSVTAVFGRADLAGHVADATDRSAVEESVAEAVRRFGGLDIVVGNAGVFPPSQRLEEMDQATWDRSLDLNLTGHLHLLRAAVPFLRRGFDPAVVLVASKNVPAPGPGAGAYSVAKAGLTQLGRVAALELGRDGIRVNMVHPHAVFDTGAWSPEVLEARARHYGMTPEEYRRNNLLRVELVSADVARVVLALAGPGFRGTTGAQVPVDGGSDRVV
jgi:rhamnose utilization protein RhaD (predicted bifunctional aldolase and dehydrogenase)/NAD(P)-dependent dehydrogenase (short-subunit alcohol dehydrogenase family)